MSQTEKRKFVNADIVQQIDEMAAKGDSFLKICETTGIGKTTVDRYVLAIKAIRTGQKCHTDIFYTVNRDAIELWAACAGLNYDSALLAPDKPASNEQLINSEMFDAIMGKLDALDERLCEIGTHLLSCVEALTRIDISAHAIKENGYKQTNSIDTIGKMVAGEIQDKHSKEIIAAQRPQKG